MATLNLFGTHSTLGDFDREIYMLCRTVLGTLMPVAKMVQLSWWVEGGSD